MREIMELKEGWNFCLCETGCDQMPEPSDAAWFQVSVPHDWAISGPFSKGNDPQPMENSILDYQPGLVQIGRSGGLPVIGVGWYRLDLLIPGGHARYFLEFDGVMSRSEVYVNGVRAAARPYGYSSFSADITNLVKLGEEAAIIVKVNSLACSSRWYAGAGIIRPVRLVMTQEDHIAYNGVWVKSEYDPKKKQARLTVHVQASGSADIRHTILKPDGNVCASGNGENWSLEMQAPELWSPDDPKLYTLLTCLYQGDEEVDRVYTTFGIRSAVFDKDRGLLLNGSPCRINGVCLHHDSGMLGAAYNHSAVVRQLSKLKDMGCNGIRTTHNPPAPQFLVLCDRMGFLVLEEAFDEWVTGKVENGYNKLFEQWAETDLRDMICRDRNHPSVILYSIGNEVPDQIYPKAKYICRKLVKICHDTDPTRPVVCAFSRPDAAIQNGLAEELDIVGLNYSALRYAEYRQKYPDWTFLASETVSCVSSRGEYYQPAEVENPPVKHDNLQVNSYDLSSPKFCYTPDVEFAAQDQAPYVAGEFVWTGFDYLGEPTPYRTEWPSRSSYFGIIDLAGIPKNRFWAYKARWGKEPVVHLFPHWNWQSGEEIDVQCYTNLDRVCLYLNGQEIANKEVHGHRVSFGKVPFVPGELKAVGYRSFSGTQKAVCQDVVRTAGSPHHIRLTQETVAYQGGDTVFVLAEIVDENGTVCPNASTRVQFEVSGGGQYLASDAGDATSTRVFSEPFCDAFHGKLVLAVRSGSGGKILVRAAAQGLEPSVFLIQNQ
jgi:beta-galactosidase